MDNLQHVAAADSQIEIDGKTYRLTAIRVGGFGEVERYVVENRGNSLKRVAEQVRDCGKLLTPEQQREVLDSAATYVAKQSDQATEEEVAQFFASYTGKAFFLWLALRDQHPEVKDLQESRELMGRMSPNQLSELSDKLTALSGMDALGAVGKNSPGPNREPVEVDRHESRGLASIVT